MPGVVRTNKDKHVGHASSHLNSFNNSIQKRFTMFILTTKKLSIGDKTECGDPAEAGSPDVYAQQHKSA